MKEAFLGIGEANIATHAAKQCSPRFALPSESYVSGNARVVGLSFGSAVIGLIKSRGRFGCIGVGVIVAPSGSKEKTLTDRLAISYKPTIDNLCNTGQ